MSIDLSTTFLGLKLKNPLVISACPLTGEVDRLIRLEQAGAAAAVLPSLFEEQIEYEADEMARQPEPQQVRVDALQFAHRAAKCFFHLP